MTENADIAFLITESTYFLSHRRPLAEGCRGKSWRLLLITNLHEADRPELAGIDVVPFDMVRVSHHPLRELATLVRLFLLLRRLRPRLLHAVGLKPVLYGARWPPDCSGSTWCARWPGSAMYSPPAGCGCGCSVA